MEKNRSFALKFTIKGNNIQTQIHNENVSLHEAVGLLDMAKHQILESLAKNKKDIFSGTMKKENENGN